MASRVPEPRVTSNRLLCLQRSLTTINYTCTLCEAIIVIFKLADTIRRLFLLILLETCQ